MNIEKLDDINIIISGTIDKSVLDKKLSKLKEQAKQVLKKELTLDAKALEKKLQEMQDQLQRETQSHILQNFIESGLKKAHINAEDILGQPNFTKYEERENGINIVVELSTTPKIDTNVEYMDIIPTYTEPKVDPKIITEKLKILAIQQAPYTQITKERAVKNGDLIVIDFEGFFNGRALEGGSAEAYKLKVGSKSFMPGFEEQMIGFNPHEEKRIKITFPSNYKAKELAGKETEFKVKLLEIREQVALPIDDALAKRVLESETATLDALKEMLAQQAASEAFSKLYNTTLKPQIIKGLLSKFDFSLPSAAIEQEIDAKVNALAQTMSKEDRVVYQESKEKFQELRNALRTEASDMIKAALIINALAEKENITVTELEVVQALEEQAKALGKDAEELVEYYKTNNLMTSAKVALIEERLLTKILKSKR